MSRLIDSGHFLAATIAAVLAVIAGVGFGKREPRVRSRLFATGDYDPAIRRRRRKFKGYQRSRKRVG